MIHTPWYDCYTPDSYDRRDVTLEHRLGVTYRIIFADHFLNLGHTGECQNHRKHLIWWLWQQTCGFLAMHLCLIQRYAAHLYKWFKVIRRAYTESSFLFPYLLPCYRVSVGGPLSGHGSFSVRRLVFLRGLYLKTVSCFPFRLSGSLKSLTLRSVFLSMTRTHVHTLTHTHIVIKTVHHFLSPDFSSVLSKSLFPALQKITSQHVQVEP